MKKLLIPLVILLTGIFIITGCSTSSTPSSPATQPATTARVPTTTVPPVTTATTPPATTPPAISPSSTAASNQQYGGVLRWIEPSAPAGPIGTPWESPFGNGSQQTALEALLRSKADGTLVPWLVSYEVNADPSNPSYTLHIKQGIKFSDGTTFDANALKWSTQMLINSHMFASVTYFKDLVVKDDYTLYMPLTEWRNSNLPAFAFNQSWVVSPTAYQKNGLDWMRTHMVGTGPFVQANYQQDVSLTTARNPNYWQAGEPYLDGVQYLFVADSMTAEALFESGGADVYNIGSNAKVASDLASKGYNILTQISDAMSLLPDSANTDSPWSNVKVRQAAEYAIDKASIAKTLGYGYWQAATQAASPSAPAYVSSITPRSYDPAKAKQLLADAGYPNGFKTKIIVQNTIDQNIPVAIQANLANAGIQADLQTVTPSAMVGIQSNGWDNGVLLIPFGFEGNIIPSMGFNFPPVRTGRYKNVANSPNYVDLYNKVATTPTLEPAIEQQIEQDIWNFNMWIPLYWEDSLWATTPKVHDTGLGTFSGGPITYWNVDAAWMSK